MKANRRRYHKPKYSYKTFNRTYSQKRARIYLFGIFKGIVIHSEVGLEELDDLIVDGVLVEVEQVEQEGRLGHELQRLGPGRSWRLALWILNNWVDSFLEEDQDAIHDTHNQVWRFRQLTNSGNIGSLLEWLDFSNFE